MAKRRKTNDSLREQVKREISGKWNMPQSSTVPKLFETTCGEDNLNMLSSYMTDNLAEGLNNQNDLHEGIFNILRYGIIGFDASKDVLKDPDTRRIYVEGSKPNTENRINVASDGEIDEAFSSKNINALLVQNIPRNNLKVMERRKAFLFKRKEVKIVHKKLFLVTWSRQHCMD